MLRRLALALLLLAVPVAALAAPTGTCTCPTGVTCDTAAGTNWTGPAACSDADGPDAGYALITAGTGTIQMSEAAATFYTIRALPNGSFVRSGTIAQTLTLSSTTACGRSADLASDIGNFKCAFECSGGSTCNFASSATRPPMNFVWSGDKTVAGCDGAACANADAPVFFLWGQAQNNISLTTDATVSWTGQEKVKTMAQSYNQGVNADDYVDCIWAPAAATVAVAAGDTIAFTSGKSDGFFYPLVAIDAECTNTCDHNDGAGATKSCTYEVKRNDTGAAYNSHLLATGRDSVPKRHNNPLDSNGDGTADSLGTMPASGDTFVIYKPASLSGGSNPFTQGIGIWSAGVQANLRYLDFTKIGVQRDMCQTSYGFSPLTFELTNPTNAAGDFAFWNIYQSVGQGAVEIQSTNNSNDSRTGTYSFVGRYWYMHDIDAIVNTAVNGAACTGGGTVSTVNTLGLGIILVNDQNYQNAGNVTLDHMHWARSGSIVGVNWGGSTPSTTQEWQNDVLSNSLYHDIPGNSTYPGSGFSGPAAFIVGGGNVVTISGLAAWNVGNNTYTNPLFDFSPVMQGTSTSALNSARLSGLWIVNWDLNSNGLGGGGILFNMCVSSVANTCSAGHYDFDTGRAVVSNSYFSNIVGSLARGGGFFYNFIKNLNLDNDGGATACDNNQREIGTELPVDFVGNVMTYDDSIANVQGGVCTNYQIEYDSTVLGMARSLSTRKRRLISNYIKSGMTRLPTSGNASEDPGWLYIKDSGSTDILGLDVYHNIFDGRNIFDTDGDGKISTSQYAGTPPSAIITFRYNIIRDNPQLTWFVASASCPGASCSYTDDYNWWANTTSSPISGGLALGTHDRTFFTSAQVTDFPGPAILNTEMADLGPVPRCVSQSRTANVWGGPVGPLRFGIDSFAHFHPAALALMSTTAFQMRYNWKECAAAFQDEIPY